MAVKTSWAAGDVLTAADLTDTFAAKAPLALSINAQTGTSYTLAIADSGRVVTMTNAAASTVIIPTNASVAVPIGSSVEVVNLSTGVNTTVSAAGGVTFNGGPVVLSPGSSVTLVKIGTDAWMAQGQGSPGLVHINTTTFSAASSVSVNNCFSSNYSNYRVIVTLSGASNATTLRFRYRASGIDNTGSLYYDAGHATTWAGTAAVRFNDAPSTSHAINSINTQQSLSTFDVITPNLGRAQILGHFQTAGGTDWSGYFGAFFNDNATFDGFTLYPAAGTITGNVRVYGYRN